jgi:hypothetical protein
VDDAMTRACERKHAMDDLIAAGHEQMKQEDGDTMKISLDDVETAENGYLEYAIQVTWGERCDDYDEDCHSCRAWKQYDDLRGVNGWDNQ